MTPYNSEGWTGENWPSLNTARRYHGCGHYVNSDHQVVYLVAGGVTILPDRLDSTELLVHGEAAWTQAGALPSPTAEIQAVSLNNEIFAAGIVLFIT